MSENQEIDDIIRNEAEHVLLNEAFRLFNKRTMRDENQNHASYLLLDAKFSQPILFRAFAWDVSSHSAEAAFTPFAPKEGYQTTQEDFDVNTRAKKLEQERIRKGNPLHGFKISVFTPLTHIEDRVNLKKLHIQLFFPKKVFEGKPDLGSLDEPSPSGISHSALQYSYFYPLPEGPLAEENSDKRLIFAGNPIVVPKDIHLLRQIMAKFVPGTKESVRGGEN